MKVFTETTTAVPFVRVALCKRAPVCRRDASRRGLCSSCYRVAAQLVHDGYKTWPTLEREGKCDPVKPSAKEYFLEFAGQH